MSTETKSMGGGSFIAKVAEPHHFDPRDLVPKIPADDFHWVMTRFREFFAKKGLIEAATQHWLDILSACEDVANLGTFRYADGLDVPLRQTGQMRLEHELLENPSAKGFFCQTTSYRFEKNPNPSRHSTIFPMAEFEIHGDLDALMQFERDLLEHFGFGKAASFPEIDYLDACRKYSVSELTHEHEARMLQDLGPVVFLKNFPELSNPFFNMKREDVKDSVTGEKVRVARKCDVIMNGTETIGSAERSTNATEMRESFHSIMGGDYAKTLFDKFGKDRVTKELDEFLAHKFIVRSGAGIGITRMIAACKAAGLIKH